MTPADSRIAHLEQQRQRYWRNMWDAYRELRELAPEKADELVSEWDREPPLSDRGRLINICATLGMRRTQLRAELPEIEKLARRTPRRDMPAEWAKVAAAKARLDPMRAELGRVESEYSTVHADLERLGAYPPGQSNSEVKRDR